MSLPFPRQQARSSEVDSAVVRVEAGLPLIRQDRAKDIAIGQQNSFPRTGRFPLSGNLPHPPASTGNPGALNRFHRRDRRRVPARVPQLQEQRGLQ